jgi:hypothetical protein
MLHELVHPHGRLLSEPIGRDGSTGRIREEVEVEAWAQQQVSVQRGM